MAGDYSRSYFGLIQKHAIVINKPKMNSNKVATYPSIINNL
ncbi:hypothetical protein PTRA_a0802 [Pseudoalteromonas translucida KMM 520]|uniref:Uncharacterized protein n=1 Tax=Pseudoalteromonas translucida KMM 520 TaxID=1315283 RepID=A0A0U2VBT7_9GAMM|nr:hypothetical protein PTRA_a0802 [Pseudoalteromonas translucida KMM 520]